MNRALVLPALVLPGLALTAAALSPAASAAGNGKPFAVAMVGSVEVPAAGDPDGFGTATLRVNPGRRELCYTLEVSGIEPATLAHIHRAPAGSSGAPVVTLEAPTSGTSSDCVEVARALAGAILRNPADYYVNVHNDEYPGGALRGQLSR